MASRSRKTTKQQTRKEIAIQLGEMQERTERTETIETTETINEKTFKNICEIYGFTDKYNADVWDGRISYFAAEGLF